MSGPTSPTPVIRLGFPIEPTYSDEVLSLIEKSLVQPPVTIELLKASLEAPK